jgi:hypothetical protein
MRDVTSLRFSLWYLLQAKLTKLEGDFVTPGRELYSRFVERTAEPRLSDLIGNLAH